MKVRHWVRADNSLTVAGVCEVSDMYMCFVLPVKLVFTVYVYAVGKAFVPAFRTKHMLNVILCIGAKLPDLHIRRFAFIVSREPQKMKN